MKKRVKTNYDIVYFISDPGSSNTPGPSGNSRTHIQSVSGAQQPQQPLEPQATTSSASQQHQQLIFSNQQPQQQPQPQRASLNSNYDLSAELVQVLVNQQQQNNQSENQNQLRSNSENQNQLRSNSENQNQLRSTQQQPQEQEEENEDSWINAYRRHRQ